MAGTLGEVKEPPQETNDMLSYIDQRDEKESGKVGVEESNSVLDEEQGEWTRLIKDSSLSTLRASMRSFEAR